MDRTVDTPGDVLLSVCPNAQCLVIAAPYIKSNALSRILNGAKSTTSLVCITRWCPSDLVFGVSDVECRDLVINDGGTFRLHPSLHAKYYRIDDRVFIGSANLTYSALGWARGSNLEILCRPGDDFDAQGFEQRLLRESREINEIEFSRWEYLTKIENLREELNVGAHSRLDTWRPSTRDLANLELAYRGKENEIASFDEQWAARYDLQALEIPPGLTQEAMKVWISTCLLTSHFANSVRQLDEVHSPNSPGLLAASYGLGVTEARRDMETVQNWFSFLDMGSSASRK